MKNITKFHDLVRLLQTIHRWRKAPKPHVKTPTSSFTTDTTRATGTFSHTRHHNSANSNLVSGGCQLPTNSSCSSNCSCNSSSNGDHEHAYDMSMENHVTAMQGSLHGDGDGMSESNHHRHIQCNDCCRNDDLVRVPVAPGFLEVYVGMEKRRFVVRAEHVNHPFFRRLLAKTDEEFGGLMEQKKGLSIACEVVLFEHLLWMMDNQHLDYLLNVDSSNLDSELCELLDCYHMSKDG